MTKTAIVDFDKTLISKDSIMTIILGEKLYLKPKIFYRGVILAFAILFLGKKSQIAYRTRFKFQVLSALNTNKEVIIEKYVQRLEKSLNRSLLEDFGQYERLIIISSAWKPFIQAYVDKHVRKFNFEIFATDFTPKIESFKICWYTQKLEILSALGVQDFDLFTDSYDDKPLMKQASRVFLVTNNSCKQL